MSANAQPPDALRLMRELLDHPREDLAVELKSWIDLRERSVQADLARELLALANHGGGYVLFGFDETEAWSPSGECPFPLACYSQDAIGQIVERYAEPAFQCGVHLLTSTAGNQHVAVSVPGGHRVPVRSRRGGPAGSRLAEHTIYVRRPGPASSPPVTPQDWDAVLERCLAARRDELLDNFRAIVAALGRDGATGLAPLVAAATHRDDPPDELLNWGNSSRARFRERVAAELEDPEPNRYANGVWSVAYRVSPVTEPAQLSELLQIIGEVRGYETGWPPWIMLSGENRPRPIDGVAEAWMVGGALDDGSTSDFWRADPRGLMFLARGYQEDSAREAVPSQGPSSISRSQSGESVSACFTLSDWPLG